MIPLSYNRPVETPDPNVTIEGQASPETFELMQKVAANMGNISLTQTAEEGGHLTLVKHGKIVKVDMRPGNIGYNLVATPVPENIHGPLRTFWEEFRLLKHGTDKED